MNPTTDNYQPSPDLPRPVINEVPTNTEKSLPQPVLEKHAEQAGVAAELPQLSQTLPAVSPVSDVPSAAPPLPTTNTDQTTTHSQHSPSVAHDDDLIEQEWVHKAKAIVEQTREDPHLQNQEINKFKADYIKKRYNKEIKVSEE